MRFGVYQVSRKGGRLLNEDRMGYCYTRRAGLFVVADGMGGHPEGEVASQLALQTVAARFQREAHPALQDPADFLQRAIHAGHRQLLRYAAGRALPDTPRTTMVAFVLQGGAVYWAHCGDSRLYVVRGRKVVARTRDHSYTELHAALAAGDVAPGSAQSVNRSVLFTCLGSPGKPVVDSAGPLALLPGDRILICSDGLWNAVPDEGIVDILSSETVSHAVPELVEVALRRAGPRSDNVTALAVEWEGEEPDQGMQHVRTGSLGDEVFASTIQSSLDADAQAQGAGSELDEADIDRSIREINEAIQRSSSRRH